MRNSILVALRGHRLAAAVVVALLAALLVIPFYFWVVNTHLTLMQP